MIGAYLKNLNDNSCALRDVKKGVWPNHVIKRWDQVVELSRNEGGAIMWENKADGFL